MMEVWKGNTGAKRRKKKIQFYLYILIECVWYDTFLALHLAVSLCISLLIHRQSTLLVFIRIHYDAIFFDSCLTRSSSLSLPLLLSCCVRTRKHFSFYVGCSRRLVRVFRAHIAHSARVRITTRKSFRRQLHEWENATYTPYTHPYELTRPTLDADTIEENFIS